VVVVLGGALVSADTLVLRDGRRVQGALVAVRDGIVEFEGQRGVFSRERLRFDREEVARIELEPTGRGDRFSDDRERDDRGDAPSRPSGMRERTVTVNAAQPWSDTSITLRPGQTIYVEATGRVRWGPGRQDGPAGERNSPRNDGRPMANRPAAALIGRIGEEDDLFFIGDDSGAIRVRGGGRLYLGINDDFLNDNTGAFRVTVYY